MLRSQLIFVSTVAIAILATIFAISSSFNSTYSSNTTHDDSKKSITNNNGNNGVTKTTTINTPHGVYQTTAN